MKKIFIILALIICAYHIYKNFLDKKPVEVKESIVVSQTSVLDINAGPTPPPKYVHIEGTVKNISDKNLTNILLKYTVGIDTLSAVVNYLAAGQEYNFITNSCRVRSGSPQYSIAKIDYEEESLY